MIHASVELIEAMGGIGPATLARNMAPGDGSCACCDVVTTGRVLACNGGGGDEDVRRVTCPKGLRLMRDAMDPVRWDFLESRGLAWKLEAE